MQEFMKKAFIELLEDPKEMKLDKERVKKYLQNLLSNGTKAGLNKKYIDKFEITANVTEQCLDDMWFEIDANDTGFITWHQVKPFLKRLEEYDAQLAEELRVAQQLQAEHIERKRIEREERERLEAERRLAEEGEHEVEENDL